MPRQIRTSLHGRQAGLGFNNELLLLNPATGALVEVANPSSSRAGTVGSSTTMTAREVGSGPIHRTEITLSSAVITLADDAGVIGYGGVKIYDFPEGVINWLGATVNVTATRTAAGVNADWDGDFALGTATAGTGNTLTSTEADLMASTATVQAVSGVGVAKGHTATAAAQLVFDGTGTAKDVFLNFIIDDTDHNIGGTPTNLLVTGTVIFTWINLGDY